MTCIIGLVEGDKVYIGADSAAASGWEVRATNVPKLFQLPGGFTIGFTDSIRMGQILKVHLSPEPQGDGVTDYHYMIGTFVEAVRQCLKDFGYATVNNNRETGGFFMVAYKGRLYTVYGDFTVNEVSDGLEAVGSGSDYALGAMWSLADVMPPEQRIYTALTVASYFSAAVLPPFHVEVI